VPRRGTTETYQQELETSGFESGPTEGIYTALIVAIADVGLSRFWFKGSASWFLSTAAVMQEGAQLAAQDHHDETQHLVGAARRVIEEAVDSIGADHEVARALLGLPVRDYTTRGVSKDARVRVAARLAGYVDSGYWGRKYAPSVRQAVADELYELQLTREGVFRQSEG
jgi:hypothetical protein